MEKEEFLSEWCLLTPGIDPSTSSQLFSSYLQGILQEKRMGRATSAAVYYEFSSLLKDLFLVQGHSLFPEDVSLFLFFD